MSNVREVLFKVEQDEFSNAECGIYSYVLFVSTSRDRALQWARDRFDSADASIAIVSYGDADEFGFAWCGDISPCLIWRHAYSVTGERMATNMTESETRQADALSEWQDECAAAASWDDWR